MVHHANNFDLNTRGVTQVSTRIPNHCGSSGSAPSVTVARQDASQMCMLRRRDQSIEFNVFHIHFLRELATKIIPRHEAGRVRLWTERIYSW